MRDGLLLMLFGYFLKMVTADRAAILVNFVFENYEAYSGLEIAIAAFFFAVQIYGDFAGYSSIAIGAAWIMGFKLMQNFNHPYFALNIQDFWRRWHISLSTWFRDYVYIPLGGSRCSKIKKYRNIAIVFLTSGLWHGANWTYIVWGALHGIYQITGDLIKPFRNKIERIFKVNTTCFSYRLFNIIITFILVDFAWIFFRAPDLLTGVTIIKQMFSVWNPWIFFDNSLYEMGLDRKDFWVLCFSVLILWVVSFMQERGIKIREELAKQNLVFRWIIYWTAVSFILIFGIYGAGYNESQFIYFQF